MENVLRVLADDIVLGLAKELRRREAVTVPAVPRACGMLVDQIEQESVSQQDNVQSNTFSEQQILLQRLERVESTVDKLATRLRSEHGEAAIGSNISGEGSKYQNVETMLKYVDGSGAEGGVKLVIMNFND